MFSWLLPQRNGISWDDTGDRSLVDSPREERAVQATQGRSSSYALVGHTADRYLPQRSGTSEQPFGGEARRARRCLSQFWLHAPVDQLQGLYRSPIGQSYHDVKAGLEMPLLTEEQEWRDGIVRKLSRSMNRPGLRTLLAAMPFFARGGKMRLMNATDVVPDWLMADYSALFDPGLECLLRRPAAFWDLGRRCRRTEWLPAIFHCSSERCNNHLAYHPGSSVRQLPVMAQRRATSRP